MSPKISIRLLAGQSDQRLVALIRGGHERAFEALVQRYRRPLLRYCRRTMRLSDARAEDVLQQALLQAWLALAGGSEVHELRPWLYRIVHNAAVNSMRGSAEPHSELTDAVQAGAVAAGESELERRIAVRDALGEVAALPRMQRQAIFLTAVDGQSHDEVADALGITHGALRGLLYRARATLRSAAAALTPAPLLEWAARGSDTSAPTAERLAELTSGGGVAGIAGLAMKGAVVAVTAGALATGATVVKLQHHGSRQRTDRRASARWLARSASDPGRAGLESASAGAPVPQIGSIGGTKSVRDRAPRRRHHGMRQGGRARHDLSGSGNGSSAGADSPGSQGVPAQPSAGRDLQVSDNGGGGASRSGARSHGGSSDEGVGGRVGSNSSGDRASHDGSGSGSTPTAEEPATAPSEAPSAGDQRQSAPSSGGGDGSAGQEAAAASDRLGGKTDGSSGSGQTGSDG
jgi:RNA polymerase sigma factor (sigma-70 family)